MAERQLQTLATQRDLLQDLLKDIAFDELLRPEAMAEIRSHLQHTAPTAQARTAEELAVLLQQMGDLSPSEIAVVCVTDPSSWVGRLAGERRIVLQTIPTAHGPEFHLFGHDNAKVMDGGRAKWEADGRPMVKEVPAYPATAYKAQERADYKIRAFRDQVLAHVQSGMPLVDVRSPGEYSGELLHMPNYPQEGAMRGGHIPGARNVPWARAANPDGTFKPADELRAIYETEQGLKSSDNVIAYCRIGERSSHTWFVLTYLLGYPNVRNYDGSWTEWGNLVGVPIEK